MASRFAPADIRADVASLPESERRALAKLVEAARLMDSLFLRQVWAGNDAMLQELSHEAVDALARDAGAAADADARAAALLPDQQGSLVAARSQSGLRRRARRRSLKAANFYPAGATKEEVQRWLDSLERRREGARHRLLHHDPADAVGQPDAQCPTASSTKASCAAPRRCCARRPTRRRNRR